MSLSQQLTSENCRSNWNSCNSYLKSMTRNQHIDKIERERVWLNVIGMQHFREPGKAGVWTGEELAAATAAALVPWQHEINITIKCATTGIRPYLSRTRYFDVITKEMMMIWVMDERHSITINILHGITSFHILLFSQFKLNVFSFLSLQFICYSICIMNINSF